MILNETIVAVSSPPGPAWRGIVRLSGPDARRVASSFLLNENGDCFNEYRGFACRPVRVMLDGSTPWLGQCWSFRAPQSYTGYDCIEIHTIGSPPILERIMELAVQGGARLALPGEFTAQALINGKMDLLEAESVAAVIHAQSDAQLRAAQAMKKSGVLREAARWKEELADLTALVEAEIDFAEEPIGFVSPVQLFQRLSELQEQWRGVIHQACSSARLQTLPRVLLLGRPNTGKSTLMNALTGVDRSICSPVAGTTRDILSAPLNLGDMEVLLLDSAGVDPEESVELLRVARDRTVDVSGEVDVILQVVDVTNREPALPVPLPGARSLVVLNKVDLVGQEDVQRLTGEWARALEIPIVAVSAQTGAGLLELRWAIRNLFTAGSIEQADTAIVLSARQHEALQAAMGAVTSALDECRACDQTLDRVELLALFLREALDALADFTGQVTTEDLLGKVFSQFCIGK